MDLAGSTNVWMDVVAGFSISVKRHQDSYKGQRQMEAGLQLQRFNPLPSRQEVREHTGRRDAEEGAGSCTS